MTPRRLCALLGLSLFIQSSLAQAQPADEPDGPSLERSALVRDPAAAGIGKVMQNVTMKTLDGVSVTLTGLAAQSKGVVVVMTSATCPISRKYGPRVAALETRYAGRIGFIFVNAVDSESPDRMRESIRGWGLKGPYVTDLDGALRRELKPSTTTEAILLDANLRVVYRGAVDDQYRLGGAAAAPEKTFLADALAALVEGRALPEGSPAATVAPGCLLDPVRPAESAATTGPTYFPEVARVVSENCLDCHRAGGAAPFGLESPLALQGRARMIDAVVSNGLMPPTHGLRPGAVRASGQIRDRTMLEADRQTLLKWLRSGRSIGTTPPSVKPDISILPGPNTWTIGLPDLIVASPGVAVPADGPLQHARQLVPINLDSDRSIEAIECRPVMRDTVDLAILWLLRPGSTLPTHGAMPPTAELLTAFSPSDPVVRFEAGALPRLPAGAIVIMDLYARPMGKAGSAQLRAAFKFAPESTDKHSERASTLLSAGPFTIDPGTALATIVAETTLDAPMRLLALRPIMRARGRTLTLSATLPTGESQVLIELGHFDPRWQIRYPLIVPVDLPLGTRLTLTGTFDNSAGNPSNPDPRVQARMGPGPTDEALMMNLEFVAP